MKAVWDSNIVIDLLNGIPQARVQAKQYNVSISVITYSEVLTGAIRRNTYKEVLNFLKTMEVIPLDAPIAALAAEVRVEKGIKLPDAIIYATAKFLGLLLVTRNTKDFNKADVLIRVPYEI